MRECIQGLGWFVRRTSDAAALGRFYASALGLPVLRHWDTPENAGTMLYAGDVAAFEINRGGQMPVPDLALAECTPIFRVRDLDAVVAQGLAAGATRAGEESAQNARTVFLCDGLGHLYGLRQANDDSALAPDSEAARRWAASDRGLAGLPLPPPTIQDLGCIRLRVEDPDAMTAFYAEMLDLNVLHSSPEGVVSLHLGGTGVLELWPGGARRTPPKDRVDVTDVWILRVYDYVAMKAHMAVSRVHQVNSLEMAGGWLDYYADPEGHLFGFQERKKPDPQIPNSNLIEDAAARQRWTAK